MKNSDNWTVGMVHELCPICLQPCNHSILVPQKLSERTKKEIEEVNGKAVGISDSCCKECSESLSDDYLALIEIDPEKSDMSKFAGIYRTGSMAWLKKDAAKEIFKNMDYFIRGEFAFLDQESFQQILSMAPKD